MIIRKALLTAFAAVLAVASLHAQDQLYYNLDKFPAIVPVQPNIQGAYTISVADTTQLDTLTFSTGFMKSLVTRKGAASSFTPLVPDGQWVTTYAKGISETVEYRKGVQTGVYEVRSAEGKLTVKGQFEAGKPTGLWTTYHPDGSIATEKLWHGGTVKIITARNAAGQQTVAAGTGTMAEEGTIKCQVQDSQRVGVLSRVDDKSGLPTHKVEYKPGGVILVSNLKGGASATANPPEAGLSAEIKYFTEPFTVAGMPDPQEMYYLSQMPEAQNLDQVRNSIGYPTEARDQDIQGRVVVKLLVDEKGKVLCALLLRNPHPYLSNAVLAKVDNLKFTPGGWPGQNTMAWVTVPFEFKLMK